MAIEPCALYTLDEAAELLHLSRRTLHGHIWSGALPGRRVYIFGRELLGLPASEPPGDGFAHPRGLTPGELAYLIRLPVDEATCAACGRERVCWRPAVFTLGELAQRVAGGDLAAMAKMLNEAGADPRLDEIEPDGRQEVHHLAVIDLYVQRAGDRVGRQVRELLRDALLGRLVAPSLTGSPG